MNAPSIGLTVPVRAAFFASQGIDVEFAMRNAESGIHDRLERLTACFRLR